MASEWSSGLDLLVGLDRAAGLREGIGRTLRDAMRDGRLAVGIALPSSRSLARDLGVARGTVSAAYRQLAAEGYLEVRQGAPVRVRWVPRRRPPPPAPAAQPAVARWDFRPGQPDSASFPRQAWARACRQVLAQAPAEVFGYGDPRGTPDLRRALAEYLGRARGVDTSPEQLLICGGFTQALALICPILRAADMTLAVEDPGPHRYRRLAEAAGLAVLPVPCDQDGLDTGHLDRSGARAVLVTPAHQYPLGITMSAARRTALVEWARRRQALIIEDDYDGEFRYDRQPAGALQHLDPGHVIYVGTTSKTLAPALRLGWLRPPVSIAAAITAAKEYADRGTSVLDQLTLAHLIDSGEYDRHVRRMRGIYRNRRDDLARALTRNHPGLHLAGISAGLHALARLPDQGPTERQIRSRAARRSVALRTLGHYWYNPPEPAPQAVIIGYATPAGHAYHPALSALTQLLTDPR
ncbi:MAG: PLP-dependent aminotransferase family protein [Actinomycetota bacterium]|nr:PLP-dependent aminotransferase family protein [Actinomycetota bacterium]